MKDELLPCPFCGFEEIATDDNGLPWCPNGDARAPIDDDAWGLSDDQIDLPENLWNRRVTTEPKG